MKQALLLFFWLISMSARAAKIIVLNGNNDGVGSLREAIANAKDGDVITFSRPTTVLLTSKTLVIGRNITIDGKGTTIKGSFSPLIKAAAGTKILLKRLNFWEDSPRSLGAIIDLSGNLRFEGTSLITGNPGSGRLAKIKRIITGPKPIGLLVDIVGDPTGGSGGCTTTPDQPVVQTSALVCGVPTVTVTVTQPTGSDIEYVIVTAGSVDIITTSNPSFSLNIGYAYTISSRLISTGCSSTTLAHVDLTAAPSPPSAPMLSVVPPAFGTSTGIVQVTSPLGADYHYSSDGGNSYQTSPTFTVAASAPYSIIFQQISSGCVSTAATGTMAGTSQQTITETTISSLNLVGSSITNAASVEYTATFADPISGLSADNFLLTTSGAVSGAAITSVTGTGTHAYSVIVSTGTGDGTLTLNLANASGITPSVSNQSFMGQSVTIDKTPPIVTVTGPTPTSGISGTYFSWVVTWSDDNLNSESINLSGLTLLNSLITTGNIDNTNVMVSSIVNNSMTIRIASFAGNGMIGFSVPANTASDMAGNRAAGQTNVTSAIVQNPQAPTTVSSINLVGPTFTSGNITYTVSFAAPISGLDVSNFSVNSTGNISGASVTAVTQIDPSTYSVAINSGSGDGTIRLDLVNDENLTLGITNLPFSGTTATVYHAPTLQIVDQVTDANNNSIAEPGEVLTYTLSGGNAGPGESYNTIITDFLPTGVTFVPGSLKIISSGGVTIGAQTDAPGDDQAELITTGGGTVVVFRIGQGAGSMTGGYLAPGAGFTVSFQVKVAAQNQTPTIGNGVEIFGNDRTGVANFSGNASTSINAATGPTSSTLSLAANAAGQAAICAGSSTNLSVAITGGTAPFTVVYTDQNNTVYPAVTGYMSGANIPVSPNLTTAYSLVSVTDANQANGTGNSGTTIITVNTPPNVTVTSPKSVCTPSMVDLTAAAVTAGSDPGLSYTYFNDQAATSPVVTPAAVTGGTYYIIASNPSTGCSTPPQAVTATVNSLPNVTFAGTLTDQCLSSTSYALTGGSPSGGSYSGTGVSGSNFDAALAGVSLNNVITYTYTDGNGCTANATNTISVNPMPMAGIVAASQVTAVSAGNTASVSSSDPGATFVWTITNGVITGGAGTSSITYTAGSSGSVNLSVAVTSSGGCGPVNGTLNVPITALPCPEPRIKATSVVCSSSAGNILSVIDASGGNGDKYIWTVTNGTITSGAGTSSITYTAGPGLGFFDLGAKAFVQVSVKITNASGVCTVGSGTYMIYISPYPLATIATPSSVCSSSSGNIASVPYAGLGASYSWSISGGTITGGNGSPNIIYKAGTSGSVTLSVSVTNIAGCKSVPGNKVVSIAAYPAAIIATAGSACAGSSGNTASVAGAGGGSKYNWSISGGTITSGLGTNSILYTAGSSGSITLKATVTNSSGCGTAAPAKSVTIVASPNGSITAPSTVCSGSTGNAASVTSAGSGASYSWSITGGTITSGGSTNAIKFSAATSGSVKLTVMVGNSAGCKSSPTKTVAITPKTTPTFIAIASLCLNAKAPALPVKSTNGISGTWSPSTISTSSTGTKTYVFTQSGSSCVAPVSINVTVQNCKKAASDPTNTASVQADLSAPDNNELVSAVVYPNPSTASFQLKLSSPVKETVEVQVFDVMGNALYHTRGDAAGTYTFGSNFIKGSYFVKVIRQKGIKVLKVIKQ